VSLSAPESFAGLEDAVVSHGFFMLAPNAWSHEGFHEQSSTIIAGAHSPLPEGVVWHEAGLRRPLTITVAGRSEPLVCDVAVGQRQGVGVVDAVYAVMDATAAAERAVVEAAVAEQIARMLRFQASETAAIAMFQAVRQLDWDETGARLPSTPTTAMQGSMAATPPTALIGRSRDVAAAASAPPPSVDAVTPSTAAAPRRPVPLEQSGRFFRSPTLWEDACKAVCCCNIAWSGTIRMCQGLVSLTGRAGAWPSPAQLTALDEEELKRRAGVGYRAKRLILLAELFLSGRADEAALLELSAEDARVALLAWPGVGPYAAAMLLVSLGHYGRIPVDTETVRHVRDYHGRQLKGPRQQATLDELYGRFDGAGGGPSVRFLAFWCEHWSEYERRVGTLRTMAADGYVRLTASFLRKQAAVTARPPKRARATPDGADATASSTPERAPRGRPRLGE